MTNLYNLKCKDCNKIIAYGLKPIANNNSYCYLCILSITEFGMLLKATKLPDVNDVYTMTHEDRNTDTQKIRSKCRNYIEKLKKSFIY